nr:MAG: acyl-CoA-binding domain containing protein [Diabrotica toursvirus 3a]
MDKINDLFNITVKVIHDAPEEGPVVIGSIQRLRLYSLYKVATEGENTTEKPPIWNIFDRSKWYAWKNLNITKDEAKILYVREFCDILMDLFLSNEQCENLLNDNVTLIKSLISATEMKKLTDFIMSNPDITPEYAQVVTKFYDDNF